MLDILWFILTNYNRTETGTKPKRTSNLKLFGTNTVPESLFEKRRRTKTELKPTIQQRDTLMRIVFNCFFFLKLNFKYHKSTFKSMTFIVN